MDDEKLRRIINEIVNETLGKKERELLSQSDIVAGAIKPRHLIDEIITNAKVNDDAAITESKFSFDATSGHNHDGTDSKRISGVIINSGQDAPSANTTINSETDIDLTGASVTFTPAVAATILITATFGYETATTGTDQYRCVIDIDDSNVATLVTDASDVASKRKSVTVSYVGNLIAASHTIKMQMSIVTGSTAATALSNACVISYIAFAQ